MKYSAVAGRYAKALLDVAIDHKKEEGYKNLLAVASKVYEDLKEFFDDPTITSFKKHELMTKILKDSGIEIDEFFDNFLKIIFERKRQKYLPLIIALYEDMEIESKGMIPVEVISPYKLSDDEREEIRKLVKKYALREPKFREKIDESLIAGVKVEFRGMTYDISVSGRIKKIARDVFGKG